MDWAEHLESWGSCPIAAEEVPADGVQCILIMLADLVPGQLYLAGQGPVGGLKEDSLVDDGLVQRFQLKKSVP